MLVQTVKQPGTHDTDMKETLIKSRHKLGSLVKMTTRDSEKVTLYLKDVDQEHGMPSKIELKSHLD